MIGPLLLCALGLYVAAGLATAAAFVTVGVAAVLPQPMTFTPGARLLLVPGAAALWPYVLIRWLRAREAGRPMTRTHRAIHRWIWPALALLVALGFTMALVLRPPPEPAQEQTQESKP